MAKSKKNKYNFCIFILTHGRADRVFTLKTLQRSNCTYPIYFVIDNEDKTAQEYYDAFGKDRVIMFDKKAVADTTDEGDNFDDRRTITHARNACFQIAEQLGYEYFIELDDDYTSFTYTKNADLDYERTKHPKSIDRVFDAFLDFYTETNFLTIAFAQGGDFIGGKASGVFKQGIKRKAMNSFICSVHRPFKFVGRMNEDVNTYTSLGSRGHLFGTVIDFGLNQIQTQANPGGITEMYKDFGTYVKSFYTVMFCPAFVKIATIGNTEQSQRIHHHINWRKGVPRILDEQHKKQ